MASSVRVLCSTYMRSNHHSTSTVISQAVVALRLKLAY